jgi:hypothetical protein
MPTCDLCDESAEKLFECKECNTNFCATCGDPSLQLCDYCLEDNEDEEDEEDTKAYIEDDDYVVDNY